MSATYATFVARFPSAGNTRDFSVSLVESVLSAALEETNDEVADGLALEQQHQIAMLKLASTPEWAARMGALDPARRELEQRALDALRQELDRLESRIPGTPAVA